MKLQRESNALWALTKQSPNYSVTIMLGKQSPISGVESFGITAQLGFNCCLANQTCHTLHDDQRPAGDKPQQDQAKLPD